MNRPQHSPTRTDTLFPYTCRFRSLLGNHHAIGNYPHLCPPRLKPDTLDHRSVGQLADDPLQPSVITALRLLLSHRSGSAGRTGKKTRHIPGVSPHIAPERKSTRLNYSH